MNESIYIGYDPREFRAFALACFTVRRHLSRPIQMYGLVLSELQRMGLYTRPIEKRIGSWTDSTGRSWHSSEPVYWDMVSQWTQSTQHANARFLVPHLARQRQRTGLALFTDGDIMARSDLAAAAFDRMATDPSKAAWCVKHRHEPKNAVKMDGQIQSSYSRKNWSSFIGFRIDHPANVALTPDIVNMLPGRELHRLCWLKDEEIGEFDQSLNWLVGHSDPEVVPDVVHFTDGVPDMPGYENCAFANEWRSGVDELAAAALGLPG